MMERLQQVPTWRWLLGAGLLGVLIYLLGVDGFLGVIAVVGVVLTALATIAAAVFTVWNPFEARPKPQLTLRPIGGEETTSLSVGDPPPVDVDAVVENAREMALAARPGQSSPPMMSGQYAKPSPADHEQYEADVETYAENVREWAQEADAWLRERATVLKSIVIQRNPSSVDAEKAGVFLIFPPETEEFEGDEADPPEAPEKPNFPLRRSSFNRMVDPRPIQAAYQARMAPIASVQAMGVDWQESLRDIEAAMSDDKPPVYGGTLDGALQVFYGRKPIHHQEERASGDPFSVRLPAGEHEIRWEVRATNLPDHATGTWTVSVRPEPSGEPITTVPALEAALRGEVEVPIDWDAITGDQERPN